MMSADRAVTAPKIGLINPKSASNVAVILRAAACFGLDEIVYTGKRYEYAKGFQEDTKKLRNSIPLSAVDDIFSNIPKDFVSVAVELTEGACPLPEFAHPEKAFYILGPEDGSIPMACIKKCEHVVYIPTQSSMNLAVTANVVLYDRLAKSNYEKGNDLIKASRDRNNNTSI
ncbi:RNA methyltransferase [Glaciecola petra]|uniref:RNA methyltransferase n=1 Tax=Glaciecola petra TaxID=3075602 RepID=A0ABU2ZV94_9ALTE|nr:RNA methyltransferase [Aestuariibacter sp. P117]MDT0596565.1 RNA methyltransferase [Aestuariibacter sp. P117]